MARERKSLIPPGSVLPPQEAQSGDVMSRIIARDRERRHGDEEAVPIPDAPPQDDNTTGNILSNTPSKPESNTTSKIESKTEENITGNTDPQASIAEQIRRSLLPSAAPAPLKVITLKLPPELDQKIEEHCGRYNRKKQDVLRDAVLLYFETLESMEAGAEERLQVV